MYKNQLSKICGVYLYGGYYLVTFVLTFGFFLVAFLASDVCFFLLAFGFVLVYDFGWNALMKRFC